MTEALLDIGPIRAVCFDVYGTLVPSLENDPYRWLLDQAPIALRRDLAQRWLTAPSSWETASVEAGLSHAASVEKGRALSRLLAGVRPHAATLKAFALCRARGWKIALASNLAQPYSQPLEQWLVPHVDAFVWSWSAGVRKPDARLFQEVEQRLGLSSQACVIVGDSATSDVAGARACGWQACLLEKGNAMAALLRWMASLPAPTA